MVHIKGQSMKSIYNKAAELIVNSGSCSALTGAGISVESGIPAFRSKGGLWDKYDPFIYASIDMFKKDPSKYWSIRGDFIRDYNRYYPNEGHIAIAELEQSGIIRSVITQNIDGLHKKAGSEKVIEIHGSLREIYCQACHREFIAPDIPEGDIPTCSCGGVLKPNTVLFGEQLPDGALQKAMEESVTCGSMLVIGTSSTVYPAAQLPEIAKSKGAIIIEVNIEKSFSNADIYLEENASKALPEIKKHINDLLEKRK